VIIVDDQPTGPVGYGLSKFRESLTERGYTIAENTEAGSSHYTIVAGTAKAKGPAYQGLKNMQATVSETPESMVVKHDEDRIILCGTDSTGLMYAVLEAAEKIRFASETKSLPEIIPETNQQPAVGDRSVSIYTMQRAWFEERLFNEDYLIRYFDQLARSRFNSFVVIFGYENGGFMAPPYPYFFTTEGYPDVYIPGLSAEQQAKNRQAFQRLIRIAHERGIRVTAGIWDHIYRGGVQSGGLLARMDSPDKPQEHMVWGLDTDVLYAYTKASIRQFLQEFPGIDGIQFRMHNESGLKRTEMQAFWHEIFSMIVSERPDLAVDLRAKELPDAIIKDALDQGLHFRIATKYWMEQMGMPFHPTQINRQNQHDRRHGYADLLKYPQKYQVHWRMWNGGTSRILLWGSADYVRRFVESTRVYNGNSFEINEPNATKMVTQPQEAVPFELLNKPYQYYDHEFERYWYFFELFGRIAYNPELTGSYWEDHFQRRFGEKNGPLVQEALHKASWILPRIVASCYPYRFFPTTRGWAEKMHMHELPFYATAEGSDIAQYIGYQEQAKILAEGKRDPRISVFETSAWLLNQSSEILDLAGQIADYQANMELFSTVTDLRILAHLARYHAHRMLAAVHYNVFKNTQNLWNLDEALHLERKAIDAWRDIVQAAGDVYADNLMMGICRMNMCGHWRDDLLQLESDYEKLDSLRTAFKPDFTGQQVIVGHNPVQTCLPNQEIEIRASVFSSNPLTGVWCHIRGPDGKYEPKEMGERKPGQFALSITPANAGKLYYYLTVRDEQGEKARWPKARHQVNAVSITADRKAPAVSVQRSIAALPGIPLQIQAEVQDASGIAWVRLRYRHLNQFEEYKTAAMQPDKHTGRWTASIPGAFIIPEWDLIYYIEAMDEHGNGCTAPHPDKEMPYIIVELQR
jgi:hypothetical protein